jgi:hypothetical protein
MLYLCKNFIEDNFELISVYIIFRLIPIINYFISRKIWKIIYIEGSCDFYYIFLISSIIFFMWTIIIIIIDRNIILKRTTEIRKEFKMKMFCAMLISNMVLFAYCMVYIGSEAIVNCKPEIDPTVILFIFVSYIVTYLIAECVCIISYIIDWNKNKDLDDKY